MSSDFEISGAITLDDALVPAPHELGILSDGPDELQRQLQAMAGPRAGPNGGQNAARSSERDVLFRRTSDL